MRILICTLAVVPALLAIRVDRPFTAYYSVSAIGVPVGFARLEYKGIRRCPERKEMCRLFTYGVNLNKVRDLTGKFMVKSDVYLAVSDALPRSEFSTVLRDSGSYNYEIRIRQKGRSLHYKAHDGEFMSGFQYPLFTLASLPLHLIIRKKATGRVQLFYSHQIFLLKLQTRPGQPGKTGNTIGYDGQDYLELNKDGIPKHLRVIPLELFGINFGDLDAKLVKVEQK